MSELRPIHPEERDLVAELYNNAYRIGMPTARGWVHDLPVDQTLAMVEPGRVASIVRMLPYRIWIGGRELAMGGIGGVATWADCQGKGYAGTLMRQSLQIMRERGDRVSSLYPFSHRYYRKFGWETSGERLAFSEFTQADVVRYDEKDLVRACLGPDDIARLDAAYREFAPGFNGMVVRNRNNWESRLASLANAPGQAYWIDDGAGRPIGYFFCENRPAGPGAFESRTSEFACSSPRAYRAMIGFFSTLPANVKTITLFAPPFPPLLDHFKEPFFPIRRQPTFQFRVVDVEPAMAERGFDPAVRGRLTLELHDEFADWNSGVWSIEFDAGRGLARRAAPAAVPELSLSIQQFSRLFIGATDPVSLGRLGLFPHAAPPVLSLLRDAFRDRPAYLADAF